MKELERVAEAARECIHAMGFVYYATNAEEAGDDGPHVDRLIDAQRKLEDALSALPAGEEDDPAMAESGRDAAHMHEQGASLHPTPPAASEGRTCRECGATNDVAAETCRECGLDLEWGNWIEVPQEQPPTAASGERANIITWLRSPAARLTAAAAGCGPLRCQAVCERLADALSSVDAQPPAASDEERARDWLAAHALGDWLEERVDTLTPLLATLLQTVRAEATEAERERCARECEKQADLFFAQSTRHAGAGAAACARRIRQRPAGEGGSR